MMSTVIAAESRHRLCTFRIGNMNACQHRTAVLPPLDATGEVMHERSFELMPCRADARRLISPRARVVNAGVSRRTPSLFIFMPR